VLRVYTGSERDLHMHEATGTRGLIDYIQPRWTGERRLDRRVRVHTSDDEERSPLTKYDPAIPFQESHKANEYGYVRRYYTSYCPRMLEKQQNGAGDRAEEASWRISMADTRIHDRGLE
jgi:hypothetical protein